jgi:hypothetical protein
MRRAAILMAAMAAVLETGCLVQITRVIDPRPMFEQARLEAGRYAGRPGRAHEVNVLVYEKDEGQLIRVSLPIWVVKKLEQHVDRGDVVIDGDDADLDHVRRVLKRRLTVEDIERAGLGTLIEVNEEDGEQVLVWLK